MSTWLRCLGATTALLALALVLPGVSLAAPDRVVITGPVTVGPNEVAGDVVVLDGPVRVAGRVEGNVVAINGPVLISGTVARDVVSANGRAVLTRTARVGGGVNFGAQAPVIARGAVVGGPVTDEGWRQFADGSWSVVSRMALWIGVSFSTLVLGLLFTLLAPRAAEAAARASRERLGESIAWGAVLLVGLPAIAVLAMITVIGIPLGLAALISIVPLAVVGYCVAAAALGRLAVRPPAHPALAFLAGWVVLRALGLVPVAGGIAWILASALGAGLLVAAVRTPRET